MVDETLEERTFESYKPIIAGILLILAGLLGILMWTSVIFFNDYSTMFEQIQNQDIQITKEEFQSIINMCSTIGIILSIFPILTGFISLKRKMWGIVILGSIIGLIIIGPLLISSILCLTALILVAISKKEFKSKSSNHIR
jgi:hypothetical protein